MNSKFLFGLLTLIFVLLLPIAFAANLGDVFAVFQNLGQQSSPYDFDNDGQVTVMDAFAALGQIVFGIPGQGGPIACNTYFDCPPTYSSNYCVGNIVKKNMTTYACILPGTTSSSCDANAQIPITVENCPSGKICSNGACVSSSTCNDSNSAVCIDSNGSHYLSCLDSNRLASYSCVGDSCVQSITVCPSNKMCYGNSCILKCTDSNGVCTDAHGVHADYCLDSNRLSNYYCGSVYCGGLTRSCPVGKICSNGKCN